MVAHGHLAGIAQKDGLKMGPMTSPDGDPFTNGQLPSTFPEVQPHPAIQRLLAEQVDMQFADLRVLLRLPQTEIAPHVGCNFTATAMIVNQISGFSVWFFHNRYAQRLEREERKRRTIMSRRRFLGFVRAYYPRSPAEPTIQTIANRLYDTRNLLSHNLGISDLDRKRRRQEIGLVKPDPALSAEDIIDLELETGFPGAGVPIRRSGMTISTHVAGLYWALGRMLRSAVLDQPERCEAAAEQLLEALPVPRAKA
jgi:hypothetical protein